MHDLDGLSPAELDALPFGVIQVDGAGRVVLYNAAESRLSGRPAASVVGRNFFRDIAPCTHLPQFHGRFLEGVRRGGFDEGFRFVFGFDPQPVRVEVSFRAAREHDRYWIVVRPLGFLAPSRQRAAGEAVGRRVRAEPVDPGVCEREPVHTPGAVQPHAVMLALDPDTLEVQACSDNVSDATGREPASIIGASADVVLPDLARTLRDALSRGDLADPARPWRRPFRIGAAPFALVAHLHDGRVVVELERVPEHPEDFQSATAVQAQDAVSRLRSAATLARAADLAAREIRGMTGFERILIYRFDADWNGEALAESKVADWDESLLGLRFPASDIPAQARALYARAPGRFVVDRDAVPASVLTGPGAANQAVDLTFAASRTLSPVHLEYQRNLGVNGSMSISILVEGALWGLVIGHHRQPHYLTPDTRALAALVTDAFALRIHEIESLQRWRAQQAALTAQNRLLERLAASEDIVSAIAGPGEAAATLLDLFGAGGAAVVVDDDVTTVGTTPKPTELLAVAAWLREGAAAGQRVFAVTELSEHYAPGEALRASASGLLAAFVDAERRHVLLWMRPEVVGTVVWGGDPNKPVLADVATRTVLPRRSFERWVENRRGQAEPWASWQVAMADALAAAIEGVVLRQGRKIRELTAKQEALARALEQKDVLAREIDHRVRNSLQIVAGVMHMQARGVTDPQAKAALDDTYARVMSVARVHDSLHQSEDVENVDLGQTLRQLCEDLAAGVTGADQRVHVRAEQGLMVASRTAMALSLIATELVINALKYAYEPGEPGHVEVSVKAPSEGRLELRVCDAGKGLPPDWGEQPRSRSPGKGGLGMQVVRAMLKQIGAEMSVERDVRPGACFTVRA